MHRFSPTATFAYFSIIQAPQKQGKWELIDTINRDIRGGLTAGDLYVETNNVFFADGRPVEHLFVEDGLHLSAEAYTQLSAYALPLVQDWATADTLPR